MIPAIDKGPGLLPLIAENVPETLRKAARWAPWAAPWDAVKKKYDKVPHRADRPASGLSNGSLAGWVTFEKALAAYLANPDTLAGIGYLMTGHHGVVGVDLDHCVKDGVIAPWALEVIAKLDSYTEISPSGTGLHVMLSGDLAEDWSMKFEDAEYSHLPDNKKPGIDVYGGGARFLTVTGAHHPGSPREVRSPPAGALDNLAARYRKSKSASKLHVLPLPDIHAIEIPDLSEMGVSPHLSNLLAEGPNPGADRSRLLISTGAELAAIGLTPEQAFAVMVDNPHIMDIALSKRGYDDTKAREYLWTHHCRRGAEIIQAERQLTADAFNDERSADEITAQLAAEMAQDYAELIGVAPVAAPPLGANSVRDDFDVVEETPAEVLKPRDLSPTPAKLARFTPQRLGAFMSAAAPEWIIRGVLPRAGLAVIYGASGSGKTFLTLDMAGAVAQGVDWRGQKTAAGRVVYVVAEGAGGFRKRVKAYCSERGLAPDAVEILVIADVPNFLDKADIKLLIEAIKKVGPVAMIVIDTYARVMAGGNENDAKDTGQAVAHCDVLHRVFKALVVLVHHSGKDATKGARGSGALRAAADLEIEVIQTRDYRAATITKMKDAEDGAEYAFRLAEVNIGVDDEGFPITSCVVEHRDATPKHQRKEDPKGEREIAVMAHLSVLVGVDNSVSKEELLEAAQHDLEHKGEGRDRRKEYLQRAIDNLVRKNLLVDDGFLITLAD